MKRELRQVGIQFTNACNGRCIMCDNRLSKRRFEYMPVRELDKIVSEIQSLGVGGRDLPTGICGIGEALLHPGLAEMLPVVGRVPWCFGTNCHSLTPEWSRRILDHRPVVVSLSVDAFFPETLKKIRPGIDYGKVVANALSFIEETRARESWDRDFFIQIVVMKQNADEIPMWVDFWLPSIEGIPGFKLHIKPVFLWPRIKDGDEFYPSPAVAGVPRHPQIQMGDLSPKPIRPTCKLFWNFAWVLSNGAYSPCCMCADDVWKIGNVFGKGSILECYNSPKLGRYRALLKAKRYSELPLCGECR